MSHWGKSRKITCSWLYTYLKTSCCIVPCLAISLLKLNMVCKCTLNVSGVRLQWLVPFAVWFPVGQIHWGQFHKSDLRALLTDHKWWSCPCTDLHVHVWLTHVVFLLNEWNMSKWMLSVANDSVTNLKQYKSQVK